MPLHPMGLQPVPAPDMELPPLPQIPMVPLHRMESQLVPMTSMTLLMVWMIFQPMEKGSNQHS